MKKALNIIIRFIEDILILSGLVILISTTFFVNKIVGWYLIGIILIILGAYFAKYPLRR